MDKFNIAVLDFKGSKMIGHGFADEIFRVWSDKYPKTLIKGVNMGKAVEMMVGRVGK